jgi:4-amino-4-deoxy-L-arabinose transferase-like glycosyltransferase
MRLRRFALLAGILLAGITLHVVLLSAFPVQRTLGDEASYTLEAHRMLDAGFVNLLPGNMISHHRPSFGFSYFSLYAHPEMIRYPDADVWIIDTPHEIWSEEMANFLRRVAYANIGLLALSALLVFLLSRECGFRFSASAAGAALMLFNPRVGLYVQSVWPEILHTTLVLAAFYVFAIVLRRQQEKKLIHMLGWLLLCGVLLAYARLTRGVVGPLIWFLSAVMAWGVWRSSDPPLRAQRLAVAVLATALLWISFEGTLWPQRQTNLAAYGSTLIGHNLWRNVEGGVGRTSDYPDEYMNSSSDPLVREELARKRVMKRVISRPIGRTIAQQLYSFSRRLSVSYYDRSFRHNRWGQRGSGKFVTGVSAVFSWCLFVTGLAGLVLLGFRSRIGVALSLFSLYYMGGLLVVIPNPRMFIALVPFLVIFTAGAIEAFLGTRQAKRGSMAVRISSE